MRPVLVLWILTVVTGSVTGTRYSSTAYAPTAAEMLPQLMSKSTTGSVIETWAKV